MVLTINIDVVGSAPAQGGIYSPQTIDERKKKFNEDFIKTCDQIYNNSILELHVYW
jgi:hypothetical protein